VRVALAKLHRALLLSSALALVAVLAGAGGAAAAGSHTLYVSTSGSDANPCSASAPCRTISHAVSVAVWGDAVSVGSGTYAEQVVVTKKLTVSGHNATIDASGQINGVVITGTGASGTVLSGFTVENATGEGILALSTSHVTIAHNSVLNNDQGHDTPVTFECTPHGAVPGDCGEAVHLMSVTHSRVIANDIENNIGGILVTDEFGPARGNLIAFNVSRNNGEDCGITLPSHNGSAMADPSKGGVYDNTVIGNLSEGNGGAGVGMFAPFPGTASYNNRVIGNTLLNNGEAGVGIHSHAPGQNVSGNVIVGNRIAGNGVDPDSGSGHPTGIALFSAVDPAHEVVAANRISDEYWGIFIAGPVSVSGLPSNKYSSSVTHHTN
jgi:nitrous oxidase accessory protein NosD